MKLLYSCVWLFVLLGAVSTAQAQLALRPLPPTRPVGIMFASEVGRTTGNSRRDDQLTDAAIKEVEHTLRQLGYDVVPRAEVIQKLIDSGINCPSGVQNCKAKDVLTTLKLGGVLLVAIWRGRTTETAADVTIEITSADAVGIAKGKLDDDVSRLVPGLVTSALGDLKNGRAVEVQIHTLPIGAEVRLDGELLGTAPAKGNAWPGPHEVTVSYPEYVTTSQHFEVPRGSDGPLPVHIALERTSARAARVALESLPKRSSATPAWDYLLGGGLGVLGAALLVSPAITLVRGGDCVDGTNSGVCKRVNFGWREGLQMAGGLLALSSAPLIFATTPIRAALSTDGDSLHAQLQGSF